MTLLSQQGSKGYLTHVLRSVVPAIMAFTLLTPAYGQLANYESYVSSLSPTELLQFSNDLTSTGSVGSVFSTNPLAVSGFTSDLDSTVDSALSIGSSEQGIKTTSDVIAPTGSLSFLFKVPDFDLVNKPEGFSADRFLFDGGIDSGSDNDSFRLQWDNDATVNDLGTANDVGALILRIGNGSGTLANSNIEATPNTWYYFGATWDKNLTSSSAGGEVRVVHGPLGGSSTTTAINVANGTGSVIGDDGHFYIGNRGTGTDNIRPDFDNDSFRQSVTGFGTNEGVIDNFAIWNDRALSASQLELQYQVLNGTAPTFSGPDNDTFADGTRFTEPGGFNWYAADASSNGNPRPVMTVEDDTAGIGDGLALFADVGGSNGDVIAVLNNQASLGANLGDTLTLSFDFRVQALPDVSDTDVEVRFGLFEDTGDEFGTNGWGESDGNFDTTSPGAVGNNGIYAKVGIDASGTQAGERTRVIETTNFADNMGGSSNGGLADDSLAIAGAGEFGVIDDTNAHTFELKLKRVNANEDGEVVQATLSMDEDGDGIFESILIDIDTDNDEDVLHLPGDGIAGDIAAQTIFDYFSIKTTANVDWVLDNLSITNGNEISAGDFNGDGIVNIADYTVWRDNLGDSDETNINNNGDGGGVTASDYTLWVENFGISASSSSSANAVPEPASAGLVAFGIAMLGLRNARKS